MKSAKKIKEEFDEGRKYSKKLVNDYGWIPSLADFQICDTLIEKIGYVYGLKDKIPDALEIALYLHALKEANFPHS